MAYTVINKPASYFNTVIYTGDGTTPRTLTGVGFKPDFSWTKRRDGGQGNTNHNLYNNVVGAGNNSELASNTTGAEGGSDANLYGYLSAFTSDGFTVADGTDATYKNLYTNNSGGTYVAWNWLGANSTATNTSGTITSTVSANTTSGFSIVSFDLTGQTGVKTVGHGLGTAPKVVITKRRSGGAGDWTSYFGAIGNSYLVLNSTSASATSASFMNNTAPTSSVFTVGDPTWWSQSPFIAYCFAEVKGFSKFGSYKGNGSADGTFIYTGFKPAFVMLKMSDGSTNWLMMDNKRNTYNPETQRLLADTSAAESNDGNRLDFLSNGFKLRESTLGFNTSGYTYIYMAFAENPFVSATAIPTTAR